MKRGKKIPLREKVTRPVVVESYGNLDVIRWSQGETGYRKLPIWVQKEYEGDKDG